MTMPRSPRIAHDDLLGDIDVDRMERVMNSEVEAMRTSIGAAFVEPQNLVDHFTRNSPQAVFAAMRERLNGERLQRLVEAVRGVMYELGQTVVPQGYGIEVSEVGSVRLVHHHGAVA